MNKKIEELKQKIEKNKDECHTKAVLIYDSKLFDKYMEIDFKLQAELKNEYYKELSKS